jgi:hypothetical protein
MPSKSSVLAVVSRDDGFVGAVPVRCSLVDSLGLDPGDLVLVLVFFDVVDRLADGTSPTVGIVDGLVGLALVLGFLVGGLELRFL